MQSDKLIRILILNYSCVLGFIFYCSTVNATDTITDTAKYDQYAFILYAEANHCVLQQSRFEQRVKTPLALIPPCYFVHRSDRTVLFYSYRDVDVLATIVIVGNPLKPEIRRKWGLQTDGICGEKAVGILLFNNAVRLSNNKIDNGVICPYMGLDEKNFWFFAHD